MKNEWMGILDCNNFFVSCERLFRPDLNGRPVVVLSSNDGCVVARSQEVKDMGVPMGVPYFQVKDILNKAQTKAFSSHFALYRDISRRVFTVMRDELDLVEEYSVDEAFFVVDGDPLEVAARVKRVVEARVGIPVSVGIARTKTLAKYANTIAKKNGGVFHLTDSDWLERQVKVKIQDIWGVGGRTEMAYKNHGILTVKDLLATDSSLIKRLFGMPGSRLQSELSGVVALALDLTKSDQKSLISSRSFRQETTDLAVIKDAVAYHVRQSSSNLRRLNLQVKVLRVTLSTSRHGDFLLRGGSKEVALHSPSSETQELISTASKLVDELYEAGVPYKKAGVSFNGLVPKVMEQGSLFIATNSGSEDWKDVNAVIDRLNKHGAQNLLLGSRLRESMWQAKKDVRSPAYTTSWKELMEVKA